MLTSALSRFQKLSIACKRWEVDDLSKCIKYGLRILFLIEVARKNCKCGLDDSVIKPSQPAVTCSKLTIETLEQGVK